VPKDTLGAFVTRLAKLPLNFEPGTEWHYGAAGIGLTVAGRLVEVVSGMPLDQFLTERIFRQLKMTDTFFYLPEDKLGRFAATYRPDVAGKIELEEAPNANSIFFRERTYFSGSGGLVSTASDYLRFQLMLLNGGELDGARILGSKTVDLMRQNHLPPNIPSIAPGSTATGWGLGVSVTLDVPALGRPGSVGSFGWSGAATTTFSVDPQEKLTYVIMAQLMPNDTALMQRIETLIYQSIVD